MAALTNQRMILAAVLAAAASAATLAGGCTPSYEDQRPPLDQVDPRDGGLQSKDVLQASDSLAADLLSLPELNASRTQWVIVFDRVEDRTNSRMFGGNYDIFLQRLRTNVQRTGRGRVTVVSPRQSFYDVRSREMEVGGGDDFQQGEAGSRGGVGGAISPDFALRGTAMDLPNRGTVYYNLSFELVNLHTRESVWTGDYEVRTSR